MLAALGSRGLCSAPLCAEILAAQMSNEPIPMDASTLAALNPNRLWVRKLLKGKAVKAGVICFGIVCRMRRKRLIRPTRYL